MQMVVNSAPVSLSNKKVNFYTCPKLTFLKKHVTEMLKRAFQSLWISKFSGGGGAYPQTASPSALETCLVLLLSLATALGSTTLNLLVLVGERFISLSRGIIFARYVPLASQSSYSIIVYSVTNYRLHLESPLGKYVIFAFPT